VDIILNPCGVIPGFDIRIRHFHIREYNRGGKGQGKTTLNATFLDLNFETRRYEKIMALGTHIITYTETMTRTRKGYLSVWGRVAEDKEQSDPLHRAVSSVPPKRRTLGRRGGEASILAVVN